MSSRYPAFESAGLTISCTVLYPEQFDALRRTYDCEKSMIESLSRCIKWNASGGKSGSAFLKTRGMIQGRSEPQRYADATLFALQMIDSLQRRCQGQSCKQWRRLHLRTSITCLLLLMLMYVLPSHSISTRGLINCIAVASYAPCEGVWVLQNHLR